MAKGELAPIRIPVVIDTAGLDAQLKNAQGKISASGLGRGGGIGGAGGFAGGGFGNGIGGGAGMGSSFAAATASTAVGARMFSTALERHAMSMSRISFQGMMMRHSNEPSASQSAPPAFSVGKGNYFTPLNWNNIPAGAHMLGAQRPSKTTTEVSMFSMNSDLVHMYSEKLHGGSAVGGGARGGARGGEGVR